MDFVSIHTYKSRFKWMEEANATKRYSSKVSALTSLKLCLNRTTTSKMGVKFSIMLGKLYRVALADEEFLGYLKSKPYHNRVDLGKLIIKKQYEDFRLYFVAQSEVSLDDIAEYFAQYGQYERAYKVYRHRKE